MEYPEMVKEAAEARIGADRMSMGLPCIPDPSRGDMIEVARLRAALEPFAKMAAHYAAYQGEDFETKDTVHGFTIGQFRRAREALGTAAPAGAPSEDDVARVLNNSRGFGYTDTPEDGQDLYDISQDALRDARAVLALYRQEAKK